MSAFPSADREMRFHLGTCTACFIIQCLPSCTISAFSPLWHARQPSKYLLYRCLRPTSRTLWSLLYARHSLLQSRTRHPTAEPDACYWHGLGPLPDASPQPLQPNTTLDPCVIGCDRLENSSARKGRRPRFRRHTGEWWVLLAWAQTRAGDLPYSSTHYANKMRSGTSQES